MTIGAVEAVFFARYTQSNFRAVYGRLRTEEAATYTKDFLQVLQTAGEVLEATLPGDRAAPTEIVYEWPTGSCQGKFQFADVRWWLKWLTNHKPLPWTIGDISSPEISIPGNPDLQSPIQADAEFDRICSSGTEPWFIAVKLAGQTKQLHVRTYFRNPESRFGDRALSLLPVVVQDAINSLPAGEGSGAMRLSGSGELRPRSPVRAAKLVAEIQQALTQDPNVLLVGPPGTGKSVALEDLRALYANPWTSGTILFDTEVWGDAWSVAGPISRSEALVFHPSYSYENFVAGLFPKSIAGGIELEAKPGPLLCLGHWVGNANRQALLILDEFNRGQAAAIFGDTLSLLDKDKRTGPHGIGVHVQRPYPSHPMPVPASYCFESGANEFVSDEVRLPSSVHIVAAMNSTDRSVAPLDAAMRRRFTVIRVRPDYDELARHFGLPISDATPMPTSDNVMDWSTEDVSRLALKCLYSLNERIEFCLGEDFLLGHALIWGVRAASVEERLSQLASAIDGKVISTLRMTFVDQDEALAAVLGVNEETEYGARDSIPAGMVAFWKLAPPTLAAIAPKRLVVRSIHAMRAEDQLKAIRKIALD